MRTIDADELAVHATLPLVARVTTADLARATPCREWDLGALLAHMTAQHRGFAAAAAGNGADPQVWQPADQPLRQYAEAAEEVITAFAAPGVINRDFLLPEVAGDRPIRGATAIGFHLVDYVVHGWDVAAAMGLPWELPADVLEAALPIVRSVPDDADRKLPGAAFAPAIQTSGELTPMAEILTLLGRSPDWRPKLS